MGLCNSEHYRWGFQSQSSLLWLVGWLVDGWLDTGHFMVGPIQVPTKKPNVIFHGFTSHVHSVIYVVFVSYVLYDSRKWSPKLYFMSKAKHQSILSLRRCSTIARKIWRQTSVSTSTERWLITYMINLLEVDITNFHWRSIVPNTVSNKDQNISSQS